MDQRANSPGILKTHKEVFKFTVNKSWFAVVIYTGGTKLFIMDLIKELPKAVQLGDKPL